jgi:hypothetical protein
MTTASARRRLSPAAGSGGPLGTGRQQVMHTAPHEEQMTAAESS